MDQTSSPAAILTPKAGWSWGAFAFNASFLIGVRRYRFLWWFLLAFVPFVNIIFWIVCVIYLGMKGHEIAARSTSFANQSEYDGYMNAQDHAGKVLFFAALIVGLVMAVIFVALIATGIHVSTPSSIPFPQNSGAAPY